MSFRWAHISLWHTQHCLPLWHHKVNALGSPWISLSRHCLFSSRALVPFSRESYLETRCDFGCSHFWGIAASRLLADSWETYMCKLTNAYTLTSDDVCACLSVLSLTCQFLWTSPWLMQHHRVMLDSSFCTFVTPFSDRVTPAHPPFNYSNLTHVSDLSIAHLHPWEKDDQGEFSVCVLALFSGFHLKHCFPKSPQGAPSPCLVGLVQTVWYIYQSVLCPGTPDILVYF